MGRLNNLDLRQDIVLSGSKFDLAVATRRDDNSMMLFTIMHHKAFKLPSIFAACCLKSVIAVSSIFSSWR